MLRSIKIRQYLAAMQARGFTPEAVLAGSGISTDLLLDPTYEVSLDKCHAIVSNIIRLTGDKAIGLAIGHASHLTDLGIIGYAMASSRTMRQAIVIWLQYANSPQGWPIRLSLSDDPDQRTWRVSATANGTPRPLFAFYWEETLALGFGFSLLFTGEAYALKEVRFSYPAPTDKARYESLFGCPVIFGADDCSVTVSSPQLDIALRGNDYSLNELCLAHCGKVMQQTANNGPTTSRLRSVLLRNRGMYPTISQVAAELDISARTLHRRLCEENTSYQKILDHFRCDLAKEYLSNGLKTKEIGYLLGFKYTDAFRQAFKGWTGQTIGEFRASNRPLR